MANGHGGKRAGAGRRDQRRKQTISFSLPQSIIAKIRAEENMSETVEIALRRYFEEKEKANA